MGSVRGGREGEWTYVQFGFNSVDSGIGVPVSRAIIEMATKIEACVTSHHSTSHVIVYCRTHGMSCPFMPPYARDNTVSSAHTTQFVFHHNLFAYLSMSQYLDFSIT